MMVTTDLSMNMDETIMGRESIDEYGGTTRLSGKHGSDDDDDGDADDDDDDDDDNDESKSEDDGRRCLRWWRKWQ